MSVSTLVLVVVVALILARGAMQLWLEAINQRYVRRHADSVPEAFRQIIDEPTYRKSVQYTLTKGKFDHFETVYDCAVLLIFLLSGVLPWAFYHFTARFGVSTWSTAACLFLIMLAMSLPGLPLAWYDQFRLEERFGFNTTTQKTWWFDRAKGLLLGFVLGYPLLVLILNLFRWTGGLWWIWAWAVLLGFQLLMAVLAPVLILPLFNKFSPLPEGSLRERLLNLANRTRFVAKSVQIMDGSKRSRHSNAFFTGFGRFRKIVLFDTLIQQLSEPELEAVLAHEIGHFKKGHIPKMLVASALGSLLGFYILAFLANQPWFYHAFHFEPGNIAPALLLFGLLSGALTFWLSPVAHWWSRRYEYQADAFAAKVMDEPRSLVGALRKLNEKNLSNLTPHPFYSAFYYSHPTLLEREAALGST
ncbi:MAG TPA: M48 family metallopeptidase [Candidatus Dormibacteraeota bacterium]|nr:M48 family metallopeptidase [Candidatus Dormibacteraeota bacterium]